MGRKCTSFWRFLSTEDSVFSKAVSTDRGAHLGQTTIFGWATKTDDFLFFLATKTEGLVSWPVQRVVLFGSGQAGAVLSPERPAAKIVLDTNYLYSSTIQACDHMLIPDIFG